jgi:hypothetical protein
MAFMLAEVAAFVTARMGMATDKLPPPCGAVPAALTP